MKFGDTFMEYLHGEYEQFWDKFSHVEYKRLKKVLKSCRNCKELHDSCDVQENKDDGSSSQICQRESCPLCDQKFFTELEKEALDIAGCFITRVRNLLHLHINGGMHKYFLCLLQCFRNNQQALAQEGLLLLEYVTMNAIAMRKILKKYDKVHSSVNGRKFKSKLRAEHIELLQLPWLIELGAFYLNVNGSDGGKSDNFFRKFSCDLNSSESIMTLKLPDYVELEYDLTCPICLETVFNPCALGCGHLFCKSCACSAASLMIFQRLKKASPESKCAVCREAGVYANAVHMVELGLLLKKRCKDYWKERMHAERAEIIKQQKEYWEFQSQFMIGY